MSLDYRCPCGAQLLMDRVTTGLEFWQAVCEAGHTCHSRTLEGPWRIVA